ncbi:MAG TPA: FliH/SctL family protein [Anaerolineaceae bacterium]|nr:FliH/SctL family protein [Anaerolineaceae bacterium]HPN52562.1 FliH/SctL family protein [Anaerolineaceae bacterium]
MKSSCNLLKGGAAHIPAQAWMPAEELKPAAPVEGEESGEMLWAQMPQPPQPEAGFSAFAMSQADQAGGSAVPMEPPAVKSKAPPVVPADAAMIAAQHHVLHEENGKGTVRSWHVGQLRLDQVGAEPDAEQENRQRILEEALNEANERLQEVQKQLEAARFEADNLLGQAHSDAQQVIEEARRRAAEIEAEARSRAEEITRAAHDQGYEEGKIEGEKMIHILENIVSETQTWRQEALSQNEEDMVQILQVITRKLFGHGVSLEPAMLAQTINRVMGEASRLGDLRIYLHPDDFAALSSLWGEADARHNGQRIELMASERIVRGGCYVEGEFGSIDNQLDVQVKLVIDALQDTFNSRLEEPEV